MNFQTDEADIDDNLTDDGWSDLDITLQRTLTSMLTLTSDGSTRR